MEEQKKDVISHPDHYKLNGLDIEVRDVIKSVLGTIGFIGFYEGNIIKYILRANKKNGLEDYKKAQQYLDWLIEELDEDPYWDRQLSFLKDAVDKKEPKDKHEIGVELLATTLAEDGMNKDITLDEFNRELTPEEAHELNELSRKMLHTALSVTKEEMERHAELVTKNHGTSEDMRERYKQNRENFLKLQEKMNKKVTE